MNPIVKSLTKLMVLERHTDCKFIVGDKVYLGHKLIFSCASEVFERMIYGDFSEGKTGEIKLRDVEPKTFELFRDFIYSCGSHIKCHDDVDQIIMLLKFGDQYCVESLKNACTAKLSDMLPECNYVELCTIFEISHSLSINWLLDRVALEIFEDAPHKTSAVKNFNFQLDAFKLFVQKSDGYLEESERFQIIQDYFHVNEITVNDNTDDATAVSKTEKATIIKGQLHY